MSKDPEDPNDNPWDVNSDDTRSKRPTKKNTEQPTNPWAKHEGTSPFRKPNTTNQNDDIFSSFIKQIKKGGANLGGNRGSSHNSGNGKPPIDSTGISKAGILGIALIALGLWLSTGVFRVQDQGGEIAVILRFGKMTRTAGPGLHYRLPYPIEHHIIKKTAVVNKIDSITQVDTGRNFDKTLVLTGDENMVHINYTVLWKIKDIKDFLFSVREPEQTILVAAESIVREIMGQTTAREALTEKRDAIELKTQELLQKVLNQYNIGVQIVKIQLQKVDAPNEVIDAFNDMQASLTDGDRMRNEAEAYHFEIVPKARGEASKIIQEAEGYEKEVIARALGEADRFNKIYVEYKKNPEVARKRMYLDTMEQVLNSVRKTIVDPKVAQGLVPYFNLQPGANAPKKQG